MTRKTKKQSSEVADIFEHCEKINAKKIRRYNYVYERQADPINIETERKTV